VRVTNGAILSSVRTDGEMWIVFEDALGFQAGTKGLPAFVHWVCTCLHLHPCEIIDDNWIHAS
jgi:hypothetical protein